MKGSIRILLGFMMVFGAVGGLDTGSATLTEGILAAIIGLGFMAWGVNALNSENRF